MLFRKSVLPSVAASPRRRSRPTTSAMPGRSGVWCSTTGPDGTSPAEPARGTGTGGRLDVGGVPTGRARDELVLAHRRGHHELVVDVAADGAGLRLHRGDVEPEAGEDPQVGVEDGQVRGLHGLLVHVERVGVGHDQLTGAQQPETGPGLVAELDLDLVDGQRELPVRVDLGPHGDGDHLLVGGPEHEGAAPGLHRHGRKGVAAEQRGPAGLLPQLDGVERGEQQLLAPGGIELLPHHLLHPVQHPSPRGRNE